MKRYFSQPEILKEVYRNRLQFTLEKAYMHYIQDFDVFDDMEDELTWEEWLERTKGDMIEHDNFEGVQAITDLQQIKWKSK